MNQRQLLGNTAELQFSAAKALMSNEVCDERPKKNKSDAFTCQKCLHSSNSLLKGTPKSTLQNAAILKGI